MRKLIIYLSIIIGFIFCFINNDKINILAYQKIDSTIGIYPIQLDIDNYNRNNLFPIDNYYIYDNNISSYNYSYTDNLVTYSTTQTGYLTFYNISLEPGTYTFSITEGCDLSKIIGIYENFGDYSWGEGSYTPNTCSVTFTSNSYKTRQINIDLKENTNGTFGKFMLVKGSEPVFYYSPYFKFGSIVGYRLNLYNPTNTNITTDVIIKNYDKEINRKSCSINANSYYECTALVEYRNGQLYKDERFYLPYNINEKGYISFNYKLTIEFSNTNIVIKNDENIANDSYFTFNPVLDAYYKDEPTDYLYFKNTYVFNSLTYIGFDANGILLNNIIFNDYGDITKNYFLQNGITINVNESSNIVANNILPNNYSNKLNFKDVFIYEYTSDYSSMTLYDYLFSFTLNIGSTSSSISSGAYYNLNLSYIGLNIINDNSTSGPLPGNENTEGKYNTCSAWYDIPCQLGNAVTYVIYEAPIISPIINFFDGLIEPIKQFIRLIDQFSGFGILFGLGITAMLICIIKKMYGGGDS